MVPLPELFERVPDPFASFYLAERPWELLGAALANALSDLPSGVVAGNHCKIDSGAVLEGSVYIGRDSVIKTGATITGAVIIGSGVEIRSGAVIHGGCWIGDGAVVGINTEVKHSIFLPGARAPHLNYVGDSVLGAGVNLGAGTKLANFRNDGGEISVNGVATGRRKLGAILGDRVKIGCNAVTNPGCVIGTGTRVYAGISLPGGVYPARQLIKLRQQIDIVVLR